MRILVTAAGAGPGVAVIKALKRPSRDGTFVAAVDMSERAAGLYLADAHRTVPAPDAEEFHGVIAELCRELDVNMIIPIFDTETPVFAERVGEYRARGIHVAVNSPDAVRVANDKRLSYEVCQAAGIPQPARVDPANLATEDFPVIGKPVSGVGAKDIVVLADATEPVPSAIDATRYLWQQFVPGEEYTIDCFGDPRSETYVAVPRLRRVVKAGQMVQGRVCRDAELIDFARRACSAFGVTDVSCLQVIRDGDGRLWFVEMNPRYGTGVSLSIEAGVDFPRLQWLAGFEPHAITPQMLEYRDGLEVLRYWEEVYL